jgi:hypothetical protein
MADVDEPLVAGEALGGFAGGWWGILAGVHWVPSLWAGLREAGTSPGPFLLLLEFITFVNVRQLILREFLNLELLL